MIGGLNNMLRLSQERILDLKYNYKTRYKCNSCGKVVNKFNLYIIKYMRVGSSGGYGHFCQNCILELYLDIKTKIRFTNVIDMDNI
jgi:transposase-like protein